MPVDSRQLFHREQTLENQGTRSATQGHKEKKDYAHVHELVGNVVHAIGSGNIEEIAEELNVPDLPRNISNTPVPYKRQLIDSHRSRFNSL